ncbi:MAG TPA: hypothetical protein PLR86_04310, partial [Planctomycetota bacterium]|nr:hypothetical protein [Planctomycetota bacterium]
KIFLEKIRKKSIIQGSFPTKGMPKYHTKVATNSPFNKSVILSLGKEKLLGQFYIVKYYQLTF